jgi:hypothetical protein
MAKSIGLAEANTSARVSIFPKHDTKAPAFVTSAPGGLLTGVHAWRVFKEGAHLAMGVLAIENA